MKKYFYLILIVGLLFFDQVLAQELKGIEKIWESFVLALKNAWQKALEIWGKIWQFFKNVWRKYVLPFLKIIWQKILDFFAKRKKLKE
jgi:hypothetical protein